MDNQTLPGILSVAWTLTTNLPDDVVSKALSGIPPTVSSPTKVKTSGKSDCQTEENYDNQASFEKSTLRFTTIEELPTLFMAFVITTVTGKTFLLGSKEKPCVVKRDNTTGLPSGDPSANSYTATFEAKKALIPCIIA